MAFDADTGRFDRHMMEIALRTAGRALGTTAPNPAVGAVIADEASGIVIAAAATAPGGRPHAEPEAIRIAGPAARGRTMYVTLEPCSHQGRTPPCANAIIAAGLSRVVVAIEDPDPRVSGRGIRMLREAGIAVTTRVGAAEARWLTRGHIVRVTERRPLVTIKIAVGPDGLVARGGGGRPHWVTSPAARARGHLLRARADAILIGAGTLADDDPDLTCRLPGLADRSPVRAILSGARLPTPECRIVSGIARAPVWIYAASGRPADDEDAAARLAAAGCRLVEVPRVAGRLWLPAVMEDLVAAGITRLLVEGGPAVWRTFASFGLVDEVVIFAAGDAGITRTPSPSAASVEPAGRLPPFVARVRDTYLPGLPLQHMETRPAGPDTMVVLRHAR